MSDLFHAEVVAALQLLAAHSTAMTNALSRAVEVLDAAGSDELHRQLAKVTELHRLVSVRLAGLLQRVGED